MDLNSVKARGGDPRVKNKNSPILLYVVALLMGFLKWAHFPLNSQRLPRYESPKIRRFHAFSTFSIGKEAKIEPQFKFSKCLIALQMLHWPPNLVSSFLPLKSRIACNRFLIFWFFGILWPFLSRKFSKIEKTAKFSPKSGHKMPKNQKIKNLLHAILDFSGKKLLTKFGGQWSIWRAIKHIHISTLPHIQISYPLRPQFSTSESVFLHLDCG